MSPIQKTETKAEEPVALEPRKRGRPPKPAQDESKQTKEGEEVKTNDKQNDKEDQVKDLDVASKDEPVVKRGRGRPPSKKTDVKKKIVDPLAPKRGRGRPKKSVA